MKSEIEWGIPRALLCPAPIRLEMGIERHSKGALVVACRTVMVSCTGNMLDWWFKYFETEEHLLWWHPLDHKRHFGWDTNWMKGKQYIGATVRAQESLGDIPPISATIKFLEPSELFGKELFKDAVRQANVSAAIFAGIGFGDDLALDDVGTPTSGRMMHVARDTAEGLVLRSRFVLGLRSDESNQTVPDEVGLGLMRHCHSEFSYLSNVLPLLFFGDRNNPRPEDNW
jgi:hypothetical protein